MKPSSLGVAMAALALNGCEVDLPPHSPQAATVQQDLASTTVQDSPKAKEAPLSQLGGKSDVVSPVDSSLGAIQEKIADLLAKGVVVLRPDGSACRKTTVVGAQIARIHVLEKQLDQHLASDGKPHIVSHPDATGNLEVSATTTFFVPANQRGNITALQVPRNAPPFVQIKINPKATLPTTCHVEPNRYQIDAHGNPIPQAILPVDDSPEIFPAGTPGIQITFVSDTNFKGPGKAVFVATKADGTPTPITVDIKKGGADQGVPKDVF